MAVKQPPTQARLQMRLKDVGREEERVDFRLTLGEVSEENLRFQLLVPTVEIPDLLESKLDHPLRKAVLKNLEQVLSRWKVRRAEPLWLSFADPCGLLPGFAWEAVLQPALKRPVLRESYRQPVSLLTASAFNVVICASTPLGQKKFGLVRRVNALVRKILAAPAPSVKVHVFADLRVYERLMDEVADADDRVTVHDPKSAPDDAAASADPFLDGPEITSPWFRWITKALQSQEAVSVLHLVAHSHQKVDVGRVALARTPQSSDEEDYGWFVGAEQIVTAMTRLGAWAVGFSSPPQNPSPTGLRLLADALARRVPGPVFLHDLVKPVAAGQIYNHLVSHNKWPTARGMQAYLQPSTLTASSSWMLEMAAPRWVATTHRFLEQHRSLPMPAGGEDEHGRLNAMAFIENLVTGVSPTRTAWSGCQEAGESVAHALEGAIAKWTPVLVRSEIADPTQLANVSMALSHLMGEVGNAERLMVNAARQPEMKTSQPQLSELSQNLEFVQKQRRTLENFRQLLDVKAIEETVATKAAERLDSGALEKARIGVIEFLNAAPEFTQRLRTISHQSSTPNFDLAAAAPQEERP